MTKHGWLGMIDWSRVSKENKIHSGRATRINPSKISHDDIIVAAMMKPSDSYPKVVDIEPTCQSRHQPWKNTPSNNAAARYYPDLNPCSTMLRIYASQRLTRPIAPQITTRAIKRIIWIYVDLGGPKLIRAWGWFLVSRVLAMTFLGKCSCNFWSTKIKPTKSFPNF